MTLRATVIAVLVLGSVGCSEPTFELPTSSSDTSTTTTTTTVPPATTQTFSGTLGVGGVRFYSFNLPSDRTVSVTLEQLQTGGGTAVAAPLTLGLGAPSGTGCALLSSVGATASETPQIVEALAAGYYCASLADPGTLTESVVFSVRIDFP